MGFTEILRKFRICKSFLQHASVISHKTKKEGVDNIMYYLPNKSDKCIHFSAFNEIHHVPDLAYYEKECSKSSIWYSPEELEDISSKMKASTTAARMLKESSEHPPDAVQDDKEYCTRGLESMAPEGARHSLEEESSVVDLLLAEQGVQKDNGVHDPENLAKVCLVQSQNKIRAAHLMALQDEQWVFLDFLCSSPQEENAASSRKTGGPPSGNQFFFNREQESIGSDSDDTIQSDFSSETRRTSKKSNASVTYPPVRNQNVDDLDRNFHLSTSVAWIMEEHSYDATHRGRSCCPVNG